jgi:hypothetical protein
MMKNIFVRNQYQILKADETYATNSSSSAINPLIFL